MRWGEKYADDIKETCTENIIQIPDDHEIIGELLIH